MGILCGLNHMPHCWLLLRQNKRVFFWLITLHSIWFAVKCFTKNIFSILPCLFYCKIWLNLGTSGKCSACFTIKYFTKNIFRFLLYLFYCKIWSNLKTFLVDCKIFCKIFYKNILWLSPPIRGSSVWWVVLEKLHITQNIWKYFNENVLQQIKQC